MEFTDELHTTIRCQNMIKIALTGCPTFGHLWATVEEELSWATY